MRDNKWLHQPTCTGGFAARVREHASGRGHTHALVLCFQECAVEPHAAVGGELIAAPDREVQFWVDRLLQQESIHVGRALMEVPMYSQYITCSSLADVAKHTLTGLQGFLNSPMHTEAACEMAPMLGATMPLRLAVALAYGGLTTAKPTYFLTDLCYAMLANLLHTECHVCPYHEDTDFKVYPRYNALPTGDTTCGKSPSYNLLASAYLHYIQRQHVLWPYARELDGNMHSDGSHGLFNERMRATRGHLLFAGPEAVNYLSPEYPDRGRCNKSSYVDMPRLLDLSTGGRYKWGTATEIKEHKAWLRHQAARHGPLPSRPQQPAVGASVTTESAPPSDVASRVNSSSAAAQDSCIHVSQRHFFLPVSQNGR